MLDDSKSRVPLGLRLSAHSSTTPHSEEPKYLTGMSRHRSSARLPLQKAGQEAADKFGIALNMLKKAQVKAKQSGRPQQLRRILINGYILAHSNAERLPELRDLGLLPQEDMDEKVSRCARHNARNQAIDPKETMKLEAEAKEGWTACHKEQQDHDQQMVNRRVDEINSNLVGVTLFSGVIAACMLDSYKSLQPDQADRSNTVLVHLSQQASSFRASNPFINSTVPAIATSSPFTPAHSAVRINMLWFSSLVFSLANALFSLFIRQWLQNYNYWEPRPLREAIRLRHARRVGFIEWRMEAIMTGLPLLLQISITLFLVGLLMFAQTLHTGLADIVTGLITVLLFVAVVSAIIPLAYPGSPFISPLTKMFQLACSASRHTWHFLHNHSLKEIVSLGQSGLIHSYKKTQRLRLIVGAWFTESPVSAKKGVDDIQRAAGTKADIAVLEWVFSSTMDEALQAKILLPCLRQLEDTPARRHVRTTAVLNLLARSLGYSYDTIASYVCFLLDTPTLPRQSQVLSHAGSVNTQLRLIISLLDGACTCDCCPGEKFCRTEILALIYTVLYVAHSRASKHILAQEIWPLFIQMISPVEEIEKFNWEEVIHVMESMQCIVRETPEAPSEGDVESLIKWARTLVVTDLGEPENMWPHAFEAAVMTILETWYYAAKKLHGTERRPAERLGELYEMMRDHLKMLKEAPRDDPLPTEIERYNRKKNRIYLGWSRSLINIVGRDGKDAIPGELIDELCAVKAAGYVLPDSRDHVGQLRKLYGERPQTPLDPVPMYPVEAPAPTHPVEAHLMPGDKSTTSAAQPSALERSVSAPPS